MVPVGLLWRLGAGACPNLPQRRPAARSAANETAEYQRFSSGVPARSGPLWQIWTTGAAAGPAQAPRATGRRSRRTPLLLRLFTLYYASFPLLRLFTLYFAPFSRTVEGEGA